MLVLQMLEKFVGFIESLHNVCSHNRYKDHHPSGGVVINPYFEYSLEYFMTFAFSQVAMISGKFSVYESSAVLSGSTVVSPAVEYVCV